MATSNFRIKKICEWCGKEFEAQKVSTRFCSHRCANFAYKRAIRKKRVQTTESQTQVQKTERIIIKIRSVNFKIINININRRVLIDTHTAINYYF